MQYTIPHCKHCQYNTSTGHCTQVMMRNGFGGISIKPNSHDCQDFKPIPSMEDSYKNLTNNRYKK